MPLVEERIGEIAATAVQIEVNRFELLRANFPSMSKEPIWDGAIYVYKNRSLANSQLRGRVPVQIKGKEVNRFSDKTCKYPVDISVLSGFKSEFGGLFFLVEILKTTHETKIFCEQLLPYDLEKILNATKKNQKNKTIPINALLKTDVSSLHITCINFLDNRAKQAASKIIPLQDIEYPNGFSFGFITEQNAKQPINYLFENPVYLYAKAPNALNIPIEKMYTKELRLNCKGTIKANGVVYYDTYEIRHTEDKKSCIKFGQGVEIDPGECRLKYLNKGDIDTQIHDLSFMLDVIHHDGFYINDKHYAFYLSSNEEKLKVTKMLKNAKNDLEDFKKLFKLLGFSITEDLNSLTKDDTDIIYRLMNVIVRKNTKDKVFTKNGFHIIKISGMPILLFSNDGEIENYFCRSVSTKVKLQYKDEHENPLSVYCLLKCDHITSIANFNKDIILESICECGINANTLESYTHLLLEAIKAVDIAPERKDILEFAKELANYLLQYDNNIISTLNWLQLQKRLGPLNSEEITMLKKIVDENDRHDILCGAMILLDDTQGFEHHFSLLDAETKKFFVSFPIYSLAKR